MRLLDLYCGAGGSAMGYAMAGFEVTGVDLYPQKNFPFEFIQSDAVEYALEHAGEYDVIHASPPCQLFSAMTTGRWQERLEEHTDFIGVTRSALTGLPYVIENVQGAAGELVDPILLCGTMFDLQTDYGSQLRRHRLFEFSTEFTGLILAPGACSHDNRYSAIGVHGGGQHPLRRRSRGDVSTAFGVAQRRVAMGIDWMTGKELNQAIPPVYTRYIGQYIMRILGGNREQGYRKNRRGNCNAGVQ